MIDVIRGDHVERLGVVSSRPDAQRIEERLAQARPGDARPDRRDRSRSCASTSTRRSCAPTPATRTTTSSWPRCARSPHVNVPLRSRGRNVGTLALLAVTRSYSDVDLQLARLIAGRVGLALDNAGLFAELEAVQLRLTTALDTLAEAVTIQDADGHVVYLNQAAAATFGTVGDRAGDRGRVRVLQRGRHAVADGGPSRPAGARGQGAEPVAGALDPSADGRRALAAGEGDGRGGRDAARGQRDRGRHRRQARRALAALPGRGRRRARLRPRLRADPGDDRRAGGSRAGRLVRGDDARGGVAAQRRRRPHRSGQARVRPRLREALPGAGRSGDRSGAGPARRLVAAARPDRRRDAAHRGARRRAARGAQPRRHALGDARADGRRPADHRRDQLRHRGIRAPPDPRRPRTGGGAGPPGRHARSRTPVSTASARTSPRRSSAACCRTSCPPSPASGSPRCTGRRARRTSSAATSTTRSRPRTAGCSSSATSPGAVPRRRR